MTALATGLIDDLGRHVENVVIFGVVDSTHAVALRLIEQVEVEGLTLRPTVVVAGRQLHGLGRGSRRWASPAGGLYLSWVSSGLDDKVVGSLPMLAAASALQAVTVGGGVSGAAIKWPNDIIVDGGKLAGILVHARRGETSCVAVGLGVNIVPVSERLEEPIHPAISIAELIGAEAAADRASAVAVRFVAALSDSLGNPEPALEFWRRHLLHRVGDDVSVRLASGEVTSGTFGGLTAEGYLRVIGSAGEETVVTGGDVIERGARGTDRAARSR